jgi:hypothetical protein
VTGSDAASILRHIPSWLDEWAGSLRVQPGEYWVASSFFSRAEPLPTSKGGFKILLYAHAKPSTPVGRGENSNQKVPVSVQCLPNCLSAVLIAFKGRVLPSHQNSVWKFKNDTYGSRRHVGLTILASAPDIPILGV